jgi:hypothetical protein
MAWEIRTMSSIEEGDAITSTMSFTSPLGGWLEKSPGCWANAASEYTSIAIVNRRAFIAISSIGQ